ncbi:MAG TPA: hypothetical protein PLF62_05655, partial [Clostridia bacterium]|nr:hypothetical protein [Clostridia bacterium]
KRTGIGCAMVVLSATLTGQFRFIILKFMSLRATQIGDTFSRYSNPYCIVAPVFCRPAMSVNLNVAQATPCKQALHQYKPHHRLFRGQGQAWASD